MLNFIDTEYIKDIRYKMNREIRKQIMDTYKNYSRDTTIMEKLDVELDYILNKLSEIEYRLNKLEEKQSV